MITWSDVTPSWARQGDGDVAEPFSAKGFRRFDANLDGDGSRIRLTLESDGAAVLLVEDADHLRNPEVLAWVAARVLEVP